MRAIRFAALIIVGVTALTWPHGAGAITITLKGSGTDSLGNLLQGSAEFTDDSVDIDTGSLLVEGLDIDEFGKPKTVISARGTVNKNALALSALGVERPTDPDLSRLFDNVTYLTKTSTELKSVDDDRAIVSEINVSVLSPSLFGVFAFGKDSASFIDGDPALDEIGVLTVIMKVTVVDGNSSQVFTLFDESGDPSLVVNELNKGQFQGLDLSSVQGGFFYTEFYKLEAVGTFQFDPLVGAVTSLPVREPAMLGILSLVLGVGVWLRERCVRTAWSPARSS